jgi:uncharacterized repeat protein (TIGR01451 family)
VSTQPNLVVRKSVDATSADPGDTLTYTISLQNTGSGDATGVSVSDNISALLAHGAFVSASSGGSLSGSTVAWSGIALDAGASRSLTFAVRLDASGWPTGTTTLTNTVVVPSSDCASGSSNTACRVSTTVTARPNLVVRKTVNASTANPGDTLTYTISVQNTGNAPAAGVDVTDDISALLARGSFVSASGGGALGGSTVRWNDLTVNPGTTQTLTFGLKLDTTGWPTGTTTLSNTVVVAGSDCASGASNAACRASTTVSANVHLVVKKAVSASSADPGDTLSYTITVQNTGNAAATGVDVGDDISALIAHGTFGSASNGGSLSGSTVRWSNLSIAAGATSSLSFSVRLDTGGWPTGTTNLPNTVVVAGSNCTAGSGDSDCRVSTSVSARSTLVFR